jgi:hypothetical protein
MLNRRWIPVAGAISFVTLALGCHHGLGRHRVPPEPGMPGYSQPAAGLAPGTTYPGAMGSATRQGGTIPSYGQAPAGASGLAARPDDPFGNVESLPRRDNMPAPGSNVVGQPDNGPSPY